MTTTAPEREQVFWTDGDVIRGWAALAEHDGIRFYRNKANHLADYYGIWRSFAAKTGKRSGFASRRQIARLIWPGVVTVADGHKHATQMRRWEHELERMGALVVKERRTAAGKDIGIEWRLLTALPSDAVSARSSAGSSVGCRVRRRRETPQERAQRAVRPRFRRSGQKGVGRYAIGRVSFSEARFGPPVVRSSDELRTSLSPRARGPGGGGFDAHRAQLPDWPTAALKALRTAAAGGRGLAALAQIEDVPIDALAIVAFEAAFPGTTAKLSHRRRRQLLNAERVLDRCADFGAGREGTARDALLAAIAEHQERVERRLVKPPGSVAFFVAGLRRAARRWKRHAKLRRQAAAGSDK